MIDHGTLALLIPIIAVGAPFLMIIVGTMTKHQRQMAELYAQTAQTNAQAVDPRIDALQSQIADLKDLVHQQTIALDRLATPLPGAEIRERIGG